MMLLVLIACEVGFWVLLAAGLFARYVLRRPRVGLAFLLATPVVDLVLFAVVTVRLTGGATAGWADGLAMVYLGWTAAFGHLTIRAVDEAVARWRREPGAPAKVRRFGRQRAVHEWRLFARGVVAVVVAVALGELMVRLVADSTRTQAITDWRQTLLTVLGFWALIALSYTLWPTRPKQAQPSA